MTRSTTRGCFLKLCFYRFFIPIKRSLYLVTSTKAIKTPKVQAFIAYYLNNAYKAMPSLGFVPLEGKEALIEQKKLVNTLKQLIPDKKTVAHY